MKSVTLDSRSPLICFGKSQGEFAFDGLRTGQPPLG
jgi:hypothetical protein